MANFEFNRLLIINAIDKFLVELNTNKDKFVQERIQQVKTSDKRKVDEHNNSKVFWMFKPKQRTYKTDEEILDDATDEEYMSGWDFHKTYYGNFIERYRQRLYKATDILRACRISKNENITLTEEEFAEYHSYYTGTN